MPIKASGTTDMETVDRFEDGVGWIAYPEEMMQRCSHAVARDDGVWLFDPVDADGVDDLVAEYGDVAGVAVLFDRHSRDAGAIASRHGVPVSVPSWMSGVDSKIDAPIERFEGEVAGFDVRPLVDNPAWQEAVCFDGDTLIVPEALGTVSYFRTDSERLGVHPMLRLNPPRSLREYDADRLLVGHGEGLFDDVPRTIRETLSNARGNTLSLYWKNLRSLVG
ncbi:MAG: hypothetical protein PPP58_10110 [Natronomonas sp.]